MVNIRNSLYCCIIPYHAENDIYMNFPALIAFRAWKHNSGDGPTMEDLSIRMQQAAGMVWYGMAWTYFYFFYILYAEINATAGDLFSFNDRQHVEIMPLSPIGR